MGRPSTRYTARLDRLKSAKRQLASIPRGELLSSIPMAKVLGVAWKSLREWCDEIDGFEASGAFQRGSNGVQYEFCPVRTVWFLIDHFQALAEAERVKAEGLAEIAMGPEDAEAARGLDLDQLKQLLDVQDRIAVSKQRSRALINAARVTAIANEAFSRMQEVALTIPQELDPSGQWDVETRAIIEKAMQTLLLRQRAAAREALENLGKG